MWLLIVLFAAWCAMAAIEFAWWYFITDTNDRMVEASYARQSLETVQLLMMMNKLINMNEAMYEQTSAIGCPYPAHTRLVIANALSTARKMILEHVGEPPYTIYEYPNGTWPFDGEGKVKL